MSESVAVLVPTCNRLRSLIFTLSGLAGQTFSRFKLVVSDQSEQPAKDDPVVAAFRRILAARGAVLEWHTRPPVHGIAEQRDFLLKATSAEMVLFLDDDVYMEPWVLEQLIALLKKEQCGFVGAFPSGLSFSVDIRPGQQHVEFWDGPVLPEAVEPGTAAWERNHLHRAANLWHVSRKLQANERRLYKVAWVASCVLYDRRKLAEVGGFSFWRRLPRYHSGEDVLVQNLLMRRWGGCGMIPSGTYHSEVPSTVLNREGKVDGHALELLDEMVEQYVLQRAE